MLRNEVESTAAAVWLKAPLSSSSHPINCFCSEFLPQSNFLTLSSCTAQFLRHWILTISSSSRFLNRSLEFIFLMECLFMAVAYLGGGHGTASNFFGMYNTVKVMGLLVCYYYCYCLLEIQHFNTCPIMQQINSTRFTSI